MKVGEIMACSFCQGTDKEDYLVDNVNKGTNNFSLSICGDHLRLWNHKYSYKGCYTINYCPICGRNLKTNEEGQTRCKECKFSRPLDRTKSPEKYYREDCIVCECEDVVGNEPMIYTSEHYCSFGRSS